MWYHLKCCGASVLAGYCYYSDYIEVIPFLRCWDHSWYTRKCKKNSVMIRKLKHDIHPIDWSLVHVVRMKTHSAPTIHLLQYFELYTLMKNNKRSVQCLVTWIKQSTVDTHWIYCIQCSHLNCYSYNVSADVSPGVLQVVCCIKWQQHYPFMPTSHICMTCMSCHCLGSVLIQCCYPLRQGFDSRMSFLSPTPLQNILGVFLFCYCDDTRKAVISTAWQD